MQLMQREVHLNGTRETLTCKNIFPGIYHLQVQPSVYFQSQVQCQVMLNNVQIWQTTLGLKTQQTIIDVHELSIITIQVDSAGDAGVKIALTYPHGKAISQFSTQQPIHFLVFVNGNVNFFILYLLGNHGKWYDFHAFGETVRQKLSPQHTCYVMYSKANQGMETHRGIVEMGTLLYKEIVEYATKYLKSFTNVYFSITGHSLGGLIARSAIKHIMQDTFLSSILVPLVWQHLCLTS